METGKVLLTHSPNVIRAAKAPALEAYGWHVDSTPDGKPWIQQRGQLGRLRQSAVVLSRDRVTIVWASNNYASAGSDAHRALPAAIFGAAIVSLPPVLSVKPAV